MELVKLVKSYPQGEVRICREESVRIDKKIETQISTALESAISGNLSLSINLGIEIIQLLGGGMGLDASLLAKLQSNLSTSTGKEKLNSFSEEHTTTICQGERLGELLFCLVTSDGKNVYTIPYKTLNVILTKEVLGNFNRKYYFDETWKEVEAIFDVDLRRLPETIPLDQNVGKIMRQERNRHPENVDWNEYANTVRRLEEVGFYLSLAEIEIKERRKVESDLRSQLSQFRTSEFIRSPIQSSMKGLVHGLITKVSKKNKACVVVDYVPEDDKPFTRMKLKEGTVVDVIQEENMFSESYVFVRSKGAVGWIEKNFLKQI